MSAHETRVFIAVLVVIAMVTLFLLFFIVTLVSYHRNHLKLYLEKVAVEIHTLEKERKRISTNLHDDIGAVLSIIKLQISSRMEGMEDELLQEAVTNVDYVVQHIRQINEELMPAVLLRKGLGAAVHELAFQVNRSGTLHVTVNAVTNGVVFNESFAIQVYRIIQEILNNALKHSEASRMEIELKIEGNQLKVVIKDNGNGFDKKAVMRHRTGLGLLNIMSRAELLGSRIHLYTAPGTGTTYHLQIPLQYG